MLDGQHLRVIQTFVRDLPQDIPVDAVEKAERFLARQATQLRPDQLEKVAHRCALRLNPDGKFSDADRARQRGFTWCGQRPDGMSIGKLVASPELRAGLDAWLAARNSSDGARIERLGETAFCYVANERPLVEELCARHDVEFRHRRANLEDVFLKLTGRDLRD